MDKQSERLCAVRRRVPADCPISERRNGIPSILRQVHCPDYCGHRRRLRPPLTPVPVEQAQVPRGTQKESVGVCRYGQAYGGLISFKGQHAAIERGLEGALPVGDIQPGRSRRRERGIGNPVNLKRPFGRITWIRRILASREAAKRRVDRLWVHVVEFRPFLTT